jgi:outer membrane usher protein
MLSGFFLAGITGNLTAGVNLQAGLDRQMGGLELAVASPLGNLSGGLAVSLGPSLIADFAVLAQYRLSIPAGTALPVISLSAGYAGRGFLLPGATQEANALSWQLSAAYGQALPFGLGMSIGVSYQRWWDLDPDRTTGTLSISRQIGKSTSLSLLATVQFQRGLPAEPRAILTLTSFPSAGGQMASVSTVVTGSSPSADLSFRSGDRQGTPSFFLSASGLPAGQDDGLAAAAGVQYTGNLFEGSLSDSLFFRRGASFGQNRLSVEAGIALVGLDGTVSLSRPISDSFAVVIPQENMEHERVVVNPDGEDPVVSQGGVGYGVISQLKSYAAAPITLDAPEAPLDSGIADVDRVLVPTYRSGIAVRVGTKATITAQGTLRYEGGEAIALQAAEIVPRGSPSASPLEVFTDEDGVFQAYGLTPGRYELRLSADEAVREPITIPPDASGWYELGTLQLAIQKGDIP